MSTESRARVTFFIPCRLPGEKEAALAVQRYLERQRLNQNLKVTGYTRSDIRTPVFHGAWHRRKWYRESVVLFIVDFPCELEDSRLDQELKRLKRVIQFFYWKVKSPQKGIWIVIQKAECFL